jgi:AAA+ ATPase superfamily predicted ATPase
MTSVPFKFGKIVDSENFTDRVAETAHLRDNFLGLVNTAIISPRRWGKSSLVRQAIDSVKLDYDSYVFVKVDLFNADSPEAFYKSFATATIHDTSTAVEEAMRTAKKYLSFLAPSVVIKADNLFSINLGLRITSDSPSCDEILDLPQKIAKEKGLRVIVCIDEFQVVGDYPNASAFQRKLRSHWQSHDDVAYCLYGSKFNMISSIFGKSTNPFYKFADILFLDRISSKDWTEYICRRFSETGKEISPDLAEWIANLVENHSFYVQQLAQLVWFRAGKKARVSDIDAAYNSLLDQLSLSFTMNFDSLTSKQKNFLLAIAKGETNLTSTAVLSQYELGTAANITTMRKKLEQAETISVFPHKTEIQDPLFKAWILRNRL